MKSYILCLLFLVVLGCPDKCGIDADDELCIRYDDAGSLAGVMPCDWDGEALGSTPHVDAAEEDAGIVDVGFDSCAYHCMVDCLDQECVDYCILNNCHE